MRKIVVIVNPISGGKSKEDIPAIVNDTFPECDYCVDIVETKCAGHGYELAMQAIADGADTIVAVGGDGTVNEIGRALITDTTVKFGLVPMGSGNGLARHAEIPMDVRQAFKLIKAGHSELIDYGDMNGHIFFTTAGTGFDAEVGQRFAEMGKTFSITGKRGPITYLRAIVEMAAVYVPKEYTIMTDDEVFQQRSFLITVGNAAQWGNKAYIAPKASQQDGLFSVTIVKPFLYIEAPMMAVQLMNRQFDRSEHVRSIETKHLRIMCNDIGYSHVDGEPMKLPSPLDVTMHPGGLRIIVPKKRKNIL
ncbi:MAG: diacylglycerol kinase family lipid kinase [Bacteroidales bacterium]|nr:diacylglycerol kinase family lipid kinase [Bacteroidales bacterium]